MKNKELFLVIGLTVILSVVVSITTIALTGNTVYAWDNVAGGYVTGVQPSSVTAQQPASNAAADAKLADESYKQDIVNILNGAFVTTGRTGEWNCNLRCSESGMQCVLAMYAPDNEKAYFVNCADNKIQGLYSSLSCVCVDIYK